MCPLRSTLKLALLGTDSSRPKARYRSHTGQWYVKASCSKCSSSITTWPSINIRSFRYSSCGLPVLNLDVGYSAFLASGPAIDVIAKIIGMPAARGRGGYMGGIQPKRELTEMNERDIARAKSKLRGAKVSELSCYFFYDQAYG
jgi:hypothetical protein